MRLRSSPMIEVAARTLTPLIVLLSIVLLIRGHHEPGGGFVGGLVAAAALVFHALATSVDRARALLPASPARLAAVGLALALLSALVGPLVGRPFLAGVWSSTRLPAVGKLGTPLLFDVGVDLVVFGVTTGILLTLLEAEHTEEGDP